MKKTTQTRAVRALLSFALIAAMLLPSACSRRKVEIAPNEFTRTQAHAQNPMKGIAVFYGQADSCPEASLEYIGVKISDIYNLEAGQSRLDTEKLDNKLAEIAERGHTAVIRVFILNPGYVSDTSTGLFLPEELYSVLKKKGDIYSDTLAAGTLEYPDFNSESLIRCMTDFIRLFGGTYDSHAAIAAIQMGLYGSWGEWNMSECSRSECVMKGENLRKIIEAYVTSFRHTKLMARNPSLGSANEFPIGYHDDNFLFNTSDFHTVSPEWKALLAKQHPSYATLQQFYDFMNGNGGQYAPLWDVWQTQMFGGELSMQVYKDPFGSLWTGTEREALEYCIRQFHVTWLMGFGKGGIPASNTAEYKEYRRIASSFGYDIYIDSVVGKNRTSKLKTLLGNAGVAPFYYDWEIEYRMTDAQGAMVYSYRDTEFRLSELLPGETEESVFFIPEDLKAGEYTVYLRLVNPAEKISKTVMPLRLSNDHETKDGYYELGRVTIE